jgi:hypothetical protein
MVANRQSGKHQDRLRPSKDSVGDLNSQGRPDCPRNHHSPRWQEREIKLVWRLGQAGVQATAGKTLHHALDGRTGNCGAPKREMVMTNDTEAMAQDAKAYLLRSAEAEIRNASRVSA